MSPQSDKLPIIVAITVKNEGANLARCLERLGRFADAVVIDNNSDDDTCAVAEAHGVRSVNFVWDGKYLTRSATSS